MKTILLTIASMLVAACTTAGTPSFTIHLIGDSTCAPKEYEKGDLERGWGMYFPNFFTEDVNVINYARNGRSTKSFIDEGRWEEVKQNMKPGDYVLIQFGHNDEKVQKPAVGAPAWGAYQENLRIFISDARKAGAFPVLLTPVSRRQFDEDGKIIDSHGDYPDAMKAVGKETGVPVIDMTDATKKWLESIGDEASKAYFMWLKPGTNPVYPEGREDNTHSVARGAHKTAGIICDSIRVKVPSLAEHLLDRPYDLVVAKDGSGDFMTLQEAVDAVPDHLRKGRFTILVKEGTYDESVVIPRSKRRLTLERQY